MPLLLGFDALVINNHQYSDNDLRSLFELFAPVGIRKFIFLCEFDLSRDSFMITADKISRFEARLKELSPRGVHSVVRYELQFDTGATDNASLKKLFASRTKRSIFVSLPMFPNPDDNQFATDLNKLLYRMKGFPIFSSVQNLIETSPSEFSQKLLSTPAGFSFDINYLFRTDHKDLTEALISGNTHILPMISNRLPNYVGIEKQIEYFCESFGKKQYYQLCSQINRCVSRAGL